MLKEILVLDLADGHGSFCSKLLADLGATVIKVERPGGDPSRGQSPSSFFYENTNKLGIAINWRARDGKRAFKNLIKAADVLVETLSPARLRLLGLEPRCLRRINSRLIHLSITPFGRTGPGCERRRSGFGRQAFYTASLFGAVSVALRLRKRAVTGRGGYFDLSVREAVASTLDHVLVDRFRDRKVAGGAVSGRSEDFSILCSSDGYVQIPILRSWDTLLELVDGEGRAEDLAEEKWRAPAYREEHLGEIRTIVERWTLKHTSRELLLLGQAMGFPWASVNSVEENLRNPQLQSRKFFSQASPPGAGGRPPLQVPGIPYRFTSFLPGPLKPAPLPGEHTREVLCAFEAGSRPKKERQNLSGRIHCRDEAILKGTRVLDLTRMLSGPYATRILADFGAEVIKVQSRKSANGAERNEATSFSAWNRNKRSLTLDLGTPGARDSFLRLAAGSDIVVENFSPRVMENWGLHYERLAEVNPGLIMVSISAMGQTGPWRNFVGFAPTFHALSGLISAASGPGQTPALIEHPHADFIAGLYAALGTLAALEYRNKTGKGQHIDLSALEAMCTMLGPVFLESQADSGFAAKPDARIGRGFLPNAEDLVKDGLLAARHFFITLSHPVLGDVVSTRSALWDWRRKPREWKSSPLLGEHNRIYLESSSP